MVVVENEIVSLIQLAAPPEGVADARHTVKVDVEVAAGIVVVSVTKVVEVDWRVSTTWPKMVEVGTGWQAMACSEENEWARWGLGTSRA
jgi:hypothetical protein